MADPRAPTRADLAKFLPDQRSIRAFEKVFELIPADLLSITDRLDLLENPPTTLISESGELTTDFYNIVVVQTGLTLTLPKCSEAIKGREWAISLFVDGDVTIETNTGDSFPTPKVANETSLVLNRRGATIGLRCVSENEWGFA